MKIQQAIRIAAYLVLVGSIEGHCQLPDGVEVTTGKASVKYCDVDPDLAASYIHITVVIANHGKKNLILSRELGEVNNLLVTNDSGKLVYSPDPTYYGTEAQPQLGSAPDDKLFEIVPPGASAERDFAIDLPISKNPLHRAGSPPPPGNYMLSARRLAWPFFAGEYHAKQIRRQWEQYGELLIGPIQITGVPVRISLPGDMRYCEP